MAYCIEKIRDDFPALHQLIRGKPPIYFDNACMTLKPSEVIEAMNDYYFIHPACHKRAIHKFGEMTTLRYQRAREAVREFINAQEPQEVVFTRNTTEGINLVAHSFPFKRGDVVLTTDLEHNSNLLPWQVLSKTRGTIHKVFPLSHDFTFDLRRFEDVLGQGVKLVSVFHSSHITGCVLPVKDIIRLSHQYGALVLIDGAQSVAHQKIDVLELDADFFAFSFHKMFGPTGMGALYAKRPLLENMPPFLVGGETVEDVDYTSFILSEIPDKFEAGLQNYAGALGAEAAVKYLIKVGIEAIRRHELKLNSFITGEILGLPKFKLLGPEDPALRTGIINFFIEDMDSGEVSILLDRTNNIMVRSGVHCAHAWYKKYNLLPSVRVSLSFYNTIEEAKIFVQTLKEIIKHF